jgi:hypothetical protein
MYPLAGPIFASGRQEQNVRTEVSAARSFEGFPGFAASPLKAAQAVRAAALGVTAALVVGLAIGAATEWYPTDVIPAATAGGPWVLVSFLVALTAAGIASATARGLACMMGLTIGYYGVGTLHTLQPSAGTASFWVPVAMVIGPLTGLAAGCVRSGAPLLGQIAAGGIPGVLLGESIAIEHRLQLLAGAGLMAVLVAWQVRRSAAQTSAAWAVARVVPVAVIACLAVGALTLSWYHSIGVY